MFMLISKCYGMTQKGPRYDIVRNLGLDILVVVAVGGRLYY